MKSHFSRPYRFNSWISTKRYQKKVTETKAQKILDRTLKMAFFTPWFLGFTTIIINFSFFIWYFYERISKKKLAKMYQGNLRISQSGQFWWPLFDSNFRTVKGIFGWNQLYQKNFTSFGNEMSKKFCNYLWQFSYMKETLSPGQRFFSHSTLFTTKVSPTTRVLKHGSLEAEWSMDIIKWP